MHRLVSLPLAFRQTCRRLGVSASRAACLISVRRQQMQLVQPLAGFMTPSGVLCQTIRISTSRFGVGQEKGSNRTPLGLHRVARKVGAGWPGGAVFKSREMIGYTWKGRPGAAITSRIFWLEGLEPGYNQGGEVDTFARYIYIHGTGDEPTLGRPASRGCIHVSGAELLPLFDRLPEGTLVWIAA